jgi:hypothetical protein
VAQFLRLLKGFFLLLLGCTDQFVQQTVGILFKALFSGHEFRGRNLGLLGAVSYFSWL